jgi:hypothetical protein
VRQQQRQQQQQQQQQARGQVGMFFGEKAEAQRAAAEAKE